MDDMKGNWTGETSMALMSSNEKIASDACGGYAVMDNLLYFACVKSERIQLFSSVDGVHWCSALGSGETSPRINTRGKLALAAWGDQLYCAWNDSSQKVIKYVVFNGRSWDAIETIAQTAEWTPEQPPALLSTGSTLYCAVLQPGRDQHIHLIWLQDGKTWISPAGAELSGIGTQMAPALAWYNGKVYCIWNGWHNDGLFFSTFDGISWKHQAKLCDVHGTQPPAAALHQGLLFVGQSDHRSTVSLVEVNSANAARVSSQVTTSCRVSSISMTGFNRSLFCSWITPQNTVTYVSTFEPSINFRIQETVDTLGSFGKQNGPALVQYQQALLCAWMEPGNTQYIRFRKTSDGYQWSDAPALGGDNPPSGIGTRCAPSLATYNGNLYCAWNGYHNDGIFYSYRTEGQWADQQKIPDLRGRSSRTDQAPVLAVYQDKLCCVWKIKASSQIRIAVMNADGTWSGGYDLEEADTGMQPASATYNNLLYCAWFDGDADELRFAFFSSLLNKWSSVSSVKGLTTFNQVQSVVKQQPVSLFTAFNKLYLAYQVMMDQKPHMALASTYNGEAWSSEAFYSLDPAASCKDNTGAPGISSFGNRLYMAWNSAEGEKIFYTSGDIAAPLKTRVFQTRGGTDLKVESFMPSKKNSPKVGVCLSGGGSRAATAALGQLRGLKHLTTNGRTDLVEQTRALSTVSGGSWFGGSFTYMNLPDISDDDFLNQYAPPEKLTLYRENNTEAVRCVLNELPPGNFGTSICSEEMYMPHIAAAMFRLYNENNIPINRAWQTVIGNSVLSKFNLYTGGAFGPDSIYSYDENTLDDDVISPNPELKDKTAFLYPQENDGAGRIVRPYWICNLSMLTNNQDAKDKFRYFLPVQATPFFTGVCGSPLGVLDNNGLTVRSGGLSPFAYNAVPETIDTNEHVAQLYQHRQMSLADIVGVSSAFFVAAMGGVPRQFPTEQEIREMIQKAQKTPPRLAAAALPDTHGVAAMARMAVDLLKELELWATLMHVLGVDDAQLQEDISQFCILIGKIMGIGDDRKNFSLQEQYMIFGIYMGVLFAFGFLGQWIAGKTDPGKLLDLIPMFLLDIWPKATEILPKYYTWPEDDQALVDDLQTNEFGDPGIFENTGLANMLAYDDIDRIICFVNSTGIIEEAGTSGPEEQNGIIKTNLHLNDEIPTLFGYQPWDKNAGGYVKYTADTTQDKIYKNNHVFQSDQFIDLVKAFIAQTGQGYRQNAANVLQEDLVTVDNAWFGVTGGKQVNVLWSVLNYAQAWVDRLNGDVKKEMEEIGDFPNYFIGFTQLTPIQLNMMSQFTAWSVAGAENAGLFKKMYM